MTLTHFVDSNGRKVTVSQQLGTGGQGSVFQVQDRPDVVAKVYLKPPGEASIRKLEAQVRACQPQVQSVSAWPSSLLKDSSGGVQGLLMPLVDPNEYQEIHNLFGPSSRRKYFPKADWSFLVHVARNVARAFAVLHGEGHVVGDVSSRNILVSQQGTVRLIDTDSFQVKSGGSVYPCPVGTAESTPPELQGQMFGTFIRDVNHDRFGLAVMLFQLLFQGRHPYSGVHADGTTPNPAQAIRSDRFAYSLRQRNGVRPPPQTLSLNDLTPASAELFERAFAPTHANRPSAADWDRALDELGRSLVTCARDQTHKHVKGKACPWCTSVQAATAKTGTFAGAARVDVGAELNRIWKGVQAVPIPPPPAKVTLTTAVSALPLPLPPAPVLSAQPLASWRLWPARILRVLAFMLLLVWALLFLYGAGWQVQLGLGLLIWMLLANTNVKKIQQAALHQQRLTFERAVRRHEQRKDQLRQMLARELQQLENKLSALQRQHQSDSALQKYRQQLRALEDRRSAILHMGSQEKQEVQAVIDRHRARALDQYLERQPLSVGQINGIGASLIMTLHQSGYRTAKDIDAQVRYVKGIGPSRARDLHHWRQDLELFFQFNPASVPHAELLAAQRAHDQKVMDQLQLLAAEVARFAAQIKPWREAQDRNAGAIRQVLAERQQREDMLRRLNETVV